MQRRKKRAGVGLGRALKESLGTERVRVVQVDLVCRGAHAEDPLGLRARMIAEVACS